MKVTVTSHIDIPKHLKKVRSDTFWTFAANEWWRLITPYTPMQTGALYQTVNIQPGEIHYIQPYAVYCYNKHFNFRTDKHPKATFQWDKAAIPTEKPKLIRAMQGYVDSGRLKLS